MLSGTTRSDIREELHRERRRLLTFGHVLALAIIAIYLPYSDIIHIKSFVAELEGIFFLLLAANLYLLVRLEKLSFFAASLMVLVVAQLFLGIVKDIDQVGVSNIFQWSMLVVPASYYLTGRRGGVSISSFLLVSIWVLYAYYHRHLSTTITTSFMINFSTVYLAISALSFLYAHTQTLNIRRILHYSQDLAFANDELKVAALTDTLTCSYNRKFLDELLSELTSHHHQNTKFSLIMIDIDYFKQVNDKYGHHVGDDILSAVTKRLQSQLRDKDILGRWGGEEFIIISQDLGADIALKLAERLRKFISGVEFPHGLKITCSFGVVEWLNNESKTQLVKRADSVLYEAKKSGRNRCILSNVA